MATAIISARVDVTVRELAQEKLDSIGKTPSEYIQELWQVLAYSDEIPVFDSEPASSSEIKQRAVEEMDAMNHRISQAQSSEFLSNLDHTTLREEWQNRDF